MVPAATYSKAERFWLWSLAIIGFGAVNGTFLYSVLYQPDVRAAAMTNPLAIAFIVEAILLVGALAYLLAKWQVSRLHWSWFVVLSLVGSIAFALPVVLLWGRSSYDASRTETRDR